MRQTEFTARELDAFLDGLPPGVRTLSLDCFDTILWRQVAQPTDVFYNLQQTPRWREAGVTAALRARAESETRRQQQLLSGRNEVSIEAIYRELLPQARAAEVDAWVAEELAAEQAHTFAFEPVLRLIRRAQARGLRVIVVSDTYLSRPQLRQLLAHRLGDDAARIAQVYCSSEHGVSKGAGLFGPVLQLEKLKPAQLAHLGDNPHADLKAPQRLGILAARLRHHAAALEQQLEQRSNAALQLMPELRYRHGLPSDAHALLAAHLADDADVPARIGYSTLGPIFAAFSLFLEDRLLALRAGGRPVRVAFLLRDGYLPARAFEAHTGQAGAAQIQVSRFTANAASLRSKADVLRLLAGGLTEKSMPSMLKQLQLPSELADRILVRAQREAQPLEAFARQVLRDDTLRVVLAQAAALRQRLLAHVRERTGLQRGETLVFVDLGYSGTVQTRLRDVFRDEMDVTLHGLYLIASQSQAAQTDREGLVGPHWADARLVHSLTAYIGLFEMMCTKAEPSTVGYTEAGEPVFGSLGTKGRQSAVAEAMQAACLRYIADLRATPANCLPQPSPQALGWQVAAELGRLIYLPAADEIACLSAFEFDFNLGTDLVLDTANLEAGQREYRREGFALMNRDFSTMRVSYPMELRHMDISLATTLLSLQRFGYGVSPSQASYRVESVPALVANATGHSLGHAEAVATHDGFFSLHLPMSASFDMSVLLGQRYEWLQIESVEKVSLTESAESQPLALGQDVILDGMQPQTGGLWHCGEGAMLFLPACGPRDHGRHMVRLVFRPLAGRVTNAKSPANAEPQPNEAVAATLVC